MVASGELSYTIDRPRYVRLIFVGALVDGPFRKSLDIKLFLRQRVFLARGGF